MAPFTPIFMAFISHLARQGYPAAGKAQNGARMDKSEKCHRIEHLLGTQRTAVLKRSSRYRVENIYRNGFRSNPAQSQGKFHSLPGRSPHTYDSSRADFESDFPRSLDGADLVFDGMGGTKSGEMRRAVSRLQ